MQRVVSVPAKMGVNTVAWANEVNLVNLINVFYEYRDLRSLGDVKKVLLIGTTNGVEKNFLSSRGYCVTTFDIDDTFKPDFLGSCDDLSCFEADSFDVVIASHVLEHLPFSCVPKALSEFARVAGRALIYLPFAGRYFSFRFSLGSRRSFTKIVSLFRFWHQPSGEIRCYRYDEHYWEVGYRGFEVRALEHLFADYFHVKHIYRNSDWPASINFVLDKRLLG